MILLMWHIAVMCVCS